MNTDIIGAPLDRIEGRLKVTGGAKYSAEFAIPNAAHAFLVQSRIGKGKIEDLDATAALKAPGVIGFLSHLNMPRLPEPPAGGGEDGPADRKPFAFQDNVIHYNGQPVALAVAETLERAIYAASLVRVRYSEEAPTVDLRAEAPNAYKPVTAGGHELPPDTVKGCTDEALKSAALSIEETYRSPIETHNPMEPHATIAVWDAPDRLTLYDATQGVHTTRKRVAKVLGLPPGNVRVISLFLGGGFGCKGPVWSHVFLAALAARETGRPVKLVLSRQQMYNNTGFRPETIQKFALGATAEGKLTGVRNNVLVHTSIVDEFTETAGVPARMLYDSPNIATTHRLARLNLGTPSFMRAPGEAPGAYSIECAMDELAYASKVDPVKLRVLNYADTDPETGNPWSSKSLKECYELGAERFEWEKRNREPARMRDGKQLIGYGMATATYPANRSASNASARILPDGTALVQAGTQDLGTGTYTIMTQIAAQALGLPASKVKFELGDSLFPETPISGGSQTCASTGSAVQAAALGLRAKMVQLAISDPASPLHNAKAEEVSVTDGRLTLGGGASDGYGDILRRAGLPGIEVKAASKPGAEREKFAFHSFGAQFCEVRIDPDLCEIRVARWLGVFGAGRIMNAKTARSQLIGGIVFGIGMALQEETVPDPRNGRIVNANLAEYHVPVCADVPPIEVIFVDEKDTEVNPLGAKGVGELGITGAAAAVANAVFHATGKRVRDLPVTLDKLLI